MQNTTHAIDNPAISAVTCTPDYLHSLLDHTVESLDDLSNVYVEYKADTTKGKQLIRRVIHAAHSLSIYLLHARSTSNTSTDISFGDREFF